MSATNSNTSAASQMKAPSSLTEAQSHDQKTPSSSSSMGQKGKMFGGAFKNALAQSSNFIKNASSSHKEKKQSGEDQLMMSPVQSVASPTLPSGAPKFDTTPVSSSSTGQETGKLNEATVSAEELEQQLTLLRGEKLLSILEQRQTTFAYFSKVVKGKAPWMNISLISLGDLEAHEGQGVIATRALHLYYMGMSVAHVIHSVQSTPCIVKAMVQLIEEYDFFVANQTVRGMKLLMAKSGDLYPDPVSKWDESAIRATHESLRAVLKKWRSEIVYDVLQTPHVPFALDYFEVLKCLLETLTLTYKRFLDGSCNDNYYLCEAIGKFDTWIMNTVIQVLADGWSECVKDKLSKSVDALLAP